MTEDPRGATLHLLVRLRLQGPESRGSAVGRSLCAVSLASQVAPKGWCQDHGGCSKQLFCSPCKTQAQA